MGRHSPDELARRSEDSHLRLFPSQLTQIVIDDVNEDEPLPEAEEGAGPLIHEDL